MADCCTGPCSSDKPPVDARYRRILWIALVVNAGMFFVELISGWHAGSVSLLADAVDFFGDAGNYAVSLFVLGLAPVWRSRTALGKGLIMGSYGVFVLGSAAYHLASGIVPESSTMGVIGFLALLANASVAALLYAYREGDANMRSVWLCSRNDAIGNIAVMLAALGVYGTGSGWPDIAVATLMGTLGLTGAWSVVNHARRELRAETPSPLNTKI
ncbi:cation transporter [Herminiimonas fonticola]|uniref:Co/Zn/Cd efflux system component n=1 Tax=Herminiimonas fonticola TaxID=303380 RepID=A0A4R6G0S1_9BURK|nr:cation transporter [Herminiimonas fonticola]RBA24366.1 Co/Zn/Cd efflux system component [Herminiimonas fonticola]TDN87310.1 Co/Zn/Cd efflux system component [Herminiimonas fonticola]